MSLNAIKPVQIVTLFYECIHKKQATWICLFNTIFNAAVYIHFFYFSFFIQIYCFKLHIAFNMFSLRPSDFCFNMVLHPPAMMNICTFNKDDCFEHLLVPSLTQILSGTPISDTSLKLLGKKLCCSKNYLTPPDMLYPYESQTKPKM